MKKNLTRTCNVIRYEINMSQRFRKTFKSYDVKKKKKYNYYNVRDI